MNATYRRIAVIVLALAVLLGLTGVWWWQGQENTSVVAPESKPVVAAAPADQDSRIAWLQAVLRKRFPGSDLAGLDLAGMQRDTDACDAQTEAVTRQRWEQLGQSGKLDDQLVHAVLADALNHEAGTLPVGNESSRLLAELSAAHPDDVHLLALHAARCSEGCDRNTAIERLIAAEPDNLSTWLLALSAATAGEQTDSADPAVDVLLAKAAQSRYYAHEFTDTMLRTAQAFKGMQLPPVCTSPRLRNGINILKKLFDMPDLASMEEPDQLALTMGVTAGALMMPTYGPLSRVCAPESVSSPNRMQSCRAILTQMADGETLMDEATGTGMMARLSAGMPQVEAAHWRERYRQHLWLRQQQAELAFAMDAPSGFERLANGEVRTWQAELKRRGLWPPPADWLPDNPHDRALVTGRPLGP